MILEELDRLIQNARIARDNVESQWGKDYWDGVLAYLLRAANRLN